MCLRSYHATSRTRGQEHDKFSSVGSQMYLRSFWRHGTMSNLRLGNFPLLTQHLSTSSFNKGWLHSLLHTVGVEIQVCEHERYRFRFTRTKISPCSTVTQQLMDTRLYVSKQWMFLGVTSPFSLKKLGNTRKKREILAKMRQSTCKGLLSQMVT